MRRVTINGRWPLVVADQMAALYEQPAGWERARLDAMAERIGPGSKVLYVGAEQGDMPALLATWGASVAMFEPGERVWANIKTVWDVNGVVPAWCFQGFAHSETRRTPRSSVTLGWPPCAVGEPVTDHGFRNVLERPEQQAIRLDDFVAWTGFVPTDISIDVEGSEFEVLRGCEATIEAHGPVVWLSLHPEFMYEQYKDYSIELNRWLVRRGYSYDLLDWGHEMHLRYAQ